MRRGKKDSINIFLYWGITMFLFGLVVCFFTWFLFGFVAEASLSFFMGGGVMVLGLFFVYRWLYFRRMGISDFSELPKYKGLGKGVYDYAQYAGCSSAAGS